MMGWMSAARLSPRGRWNTIIVVLAHAVLVGMLAWQIWRALADSGAPSIGNLIALATSVLIPALLLGLVVWLFAKTGVLMVVTNVPVALIYGAFLSGKLNHEPAELLRLGPMTPVIAAFLCSVIGILGGWRLPGPRLRAPKGVAA
jgi:hypothetical protein